MRHKSSSQNALSTVSYLFLIVGIMACLQIVASALSGSYRLNFGAIGLAGIGIFIGLRKYSPVWHKCALLFSAYFIITLSVTIIICLFSQSFFGRIFLGEPLVNGAAPWLFIPLLAWLAVSVRQYQILKHPAICRLFEEKRRTVTEAVHVTEPAPLAVEASHS